MSKTIEFILTEDGSPTAYFDNFGSDNFQHEKMHHSGGAFGESVYIYGPAIQWGFAKLDHPQILSLGTGIAYNEILSAAFSIVFDAPLKMASYEANNDLNEALIAWLKNSQEKIVPFKIYDSVLEMTANVFDISGEEIKSKMLSSFVAGDWKIKDAWDSQDREKYNVVIYDFFSSKAMEPFWTEEFLTEFLMKNADKKCSFGTYACTGKLKRALKANHFTYYKRKGYLWKRSSTFACRG
ncbi:MAG: MnmC family methyltransferase [Bdellovibrionota bacterium]